MIEFFIVSKKNNGELSIIKQHKESYGVLHATTEAILFFLFFDSFEKYKFIAQNKTILESSKTDLMLFIQTANHLSLTAEEMMKKINKLYFEMLESSPELFI